MNSNPDHLPDRILSMHEQAVREMEEPRDGISPTPVSFLLMCFVLTAWGGYYIADNPGNWSGMEYNAKPANLAAAAPTAQEDPMVLGKEIFNACAQCHQANGIGVAGAYPPLVASDFVTGDPRRLAAILINGINGPITVNGANYTGEMPAWKALYSDEEIAAVLTYARGSWGNKAPPISKDIVAAVRAELSTNATPWSAASLAAFAAETPPKAVAAATK